MTQPAQAFRYLLRRAQRRLLAIRLLRAGFAAGGFGAVIASTFAASGICSRTDIALLAAATSLTAVLATVLFFRPSLARVARLGDRQAPHDENCLTTAAERIRASAPAPMDTLLLARALAQLSASPPRPPRAEPFAIAVVVATWIAAAALGLWTAPPADQAGRTMARLDAMSLARRATLAAKLDEAIDRATTNHDQQLRRDLRALAKSVEVRDEAAYRTLLETLKAQGLILREVLPEALQIAGLDSHAAKPAAAATAIDPVASASNAEGSSIRIYTPPTKTAAANDTPPAEGTFDFDNAWNRARREALQPPANTLRSPRDHAVLERYFKP